MIGAETIFQRAFVLLLVFGVLFFLLKIPNNRFKGRQKALVRFFLAVYTVTYFTGASIIYLLGEMAFYLYFSITLFVPTAADIDTFFLLALIPFLVLILISLLPSLKLGGTSATVVGKKVGLIDRSPFSLTALTAFLVLAFSASLLGGASLDLLRGSLSLLDVTSIGSLYEARALAMGGMNFIQGGVLYGTLPALTCGLLLYSGRHARLIRIQAYFCLALTLLLNLGLHQTAPLFAFAFIYVNVRILLGTDVILSIRNAMLGGTAFVGYVFYSAIKSAGGVPSVLFSFYDIVMRMPVAGPYLVSMRDFNAGNITAQDYVPRILGYYMFPEFLAKDSHISMPQPSFMVSWYVFGAAGSILILLVSILLALLLSKYSLVGPSSNPGFASVTITYSLFHYVYYTFQTSHLETLLSSYGIIFPLLPPIVFIVLRLIASPFRVIQVHPR